MLTNVALPSRAGERCTESGIDSMHWLKQSNANQKRIDQFLNFPNSVVYEFNSRGFRDHEWPNNEQLKDAVWCIGDSFTLGIGSPFDHIWPQVLQRRSNRRTINVAMDGASNEWISMMAKYILKEIKPTNLVIMWSYLHRRYGGLSTLNNNQRDDLLTEGADKYWKLFYHDVRLETWPLEAPSLKDFAQLPEHIRRDFRDVHVNNWLIVADDLGSARISDDLDRRIHAEITRNRDDVENIKSCVLDTKSLQGDTNIVQSIIPQFAPTKYVPEVLEFLAQQAPCLEYFDRPLDRARDLHHFDIKTSEWIVDQLLPLIK